MNSNLDDETKRDIAKAAATAAAAALMTALVPVLAEGAKYLVRRFWPEAEGKEEKE